MEHPFFMNGAGNPARAEALRWLSIAEKLLTNRDLVGSKSFATRARDSDPTLLPADQILAIVDTLIAGDKRINNQHLDYYSILQIPSNQTHDPELIANQYRRLALLLNPQKNNFPFSDHAFGLVVDAWSVLSNAFRRSVYDKEIGFFLNLNPVSVTSPPQNFNMQQQQQSTGSVIFEQSHAPARERLQTVTFLQDLQTQPMSSQPATFTFGSSSTMLSSDREQQQQPFSFGSSSATRGQQQVASVEQQGYKQVTPKRNEVFFGNNQNHSASTSNRNVNIEGLFGDTQNHSATAGRKNLNNVNHEGLFGSNQGQSATITNKNLNNVNHEDLFGNYQNHSVATSNKNVNNEGLFGNSQNNSTTTGKEKGNDGAGKEGVVDDAIPSFWTACPYCYLMYEYALDYVDCTLRCQNCKRAFQAVKIASPPPIVEGKEAYICCWGFMPLGFSLDTFKKCKGNISSWTPYAPIFNKKGGVRKSSAPRVYIDDLEEDVFLQLSESSEDSDEDWRRQNYIKKKKKSRSGKKMNRRTRRKKAGMQQAVKGKNVEGNDGGGTMQASATQGGVEERPNVKTAESSKRGVASNTRRQSGKVPKDFGKLDLNVEFSNEVEEPPAPGVAQGNGTGTGEDGPIEGIEFFEGLDEFLSSLPILNAVGDDKGKAT